MKHFSIVLFALLALLASTQAGATPWVQGYYVGYDTYGTFTPNVVIHVFADEPKIQFSMNGGGYGAPYYGGWLAWELDYSGEEHYNGGNIDFWGVGGHHLDLKVYQYNSLGQLVVVASQSLNFTLAYPVPVAPAISGSSSNYHPVLSWNDIGFYAVTNNSTNGYEVYRQDWYGGGEVNLKRDWTLIASLSGTTLSYTDTEILHNPYGANDHVKYKIRAVDIAAQTSAYSNVLDFGAELPKPFVDTIPVQFSLGNYPNPFNPTTQVCYDLPSAGHVSLKILDLQGREVKTLQSGFSEAGAYKATWDAVNQATGLYFARLVMTDQWGKAVYTKTNKLLLTR